MNLSQIKLASISAMRDELESINRTLHRAEKLRDLREKTAGPIGAVGRFAGRQFTHAGNAIGSFSTPVQSLKAGWKATGSRPWQALTVAGGALEAPEAFKKVDPTGKGRSRGERIGRWAGAQAGGLIGSTHHLTGSLVGDAVGRGAGGFVGKAADNVVRRRKAPAVLSHPPMAAPVTSSNQER